jgi:hypothetical protein
VHSFQQNPTSYANRQGGVITTLSYTKRRCKPIAEDLVQMFVEK